MFGEEKNNGRDFLTGDNASLVPVSRTLSPMAVIAGYAASYANNPTARNVTTAAFHEQCRAMLTKVTLDNVAALSALEAHLYRVAPFGEERYKTIIDAYAVSTVMRIARW